MISIGGWVKLYRDILDKAIWQKSTAEQKAVLITILLLASHKENEWEWQGRRFTIQPGQFITSLPSLAETAGVSIQNVRSALIRFVKYEFLTDQSTATGRLISVVNWGLYQSDDNETNRLPNRQTTDLQQTTNRLLTAIKNDKNVKNDKEDNTPPTPPRGSGEEPIVPSKNKGAETKAKIREVWLKHSFSPSLETTIKSWGVYKAERNERYKPAGLNSLLVQIGKHAKTFGEDTVIQLIENSMANNWAGIAWDRLKNSKPNRQAVTSAKNYDESF